MIDIRWDGERILWSEVFSVGHEDLDQHHRTIFERINDLHASLEEGHTLDVIRERLEAFVHDVLSHFEAEETLLRQAAFPDFDRHRRLHRELEGHLMEMRAHCEAGDIASLESEEWPLLKTWLAAHILFVDTTYAGAIS